MSPLEEQARNILTPFAFKRFQELFGRASQYLVIENFGNEFIMQHFKDGNSRKHKVSWDGTWAICSCKNFEFWGILCRHILSVLSHKDCFEIPIAYLPSCWHHDGLPGKERNVTPTNGDISTEMAIIFYENLVHCPPSCDEIVVHCPPSSKTKGRPKQKRMIGGKELGKKSRSC